MAAPTVPPKARVRVLVVDDSPISRDAIAAVLSCDPEIEVVGFAKDGKDAVDAVKRKRPDVVTLDVVMPRMDGVTAAEIIMREQPTPILMMTGDPKFQTAAERERALSVGALAWHIKDDMVGNPETSSLGRELKLLAQVRVVRHPNVRVVDQVQEFTPPPRLPLLRGPLELVCVGSSTGGPQILQTLLRGLPRDFPPPVVIVQHIHPAFTESLAGWLSTATDREVRLAVDGAVLRPGSVWMAPPGQHTVIRQRGVLALAAGMTSENHVHTPSVDALFTSAAETYGAGALGVVLTGMGSDGAEGAQELKKRGATILVQDENSSVVYGMPQSVIDRGLADAILKPTRIAEELARRALGQVGKPIA